MAVSFSKITWTFSAWALASFVLVVMVDVKMCVYVCRSSEDYTACVLDGRCMLLKRILICRIRNRNYLRNSCLAANAKILGFFNNSRKPHHFNIYKVAPLSIHIRTNAKLLLAFARFCHANFFLVTSKCVCRMCECFHPHFWYLNIFCLTIKSKF